MSALPRLESPRIQDLGLDDSHSAAYTAILRAEGNAIREQSNARRRHDVTLEEDQKLVSIRVAGYLLLEFIEKSHIFNQQPSQQLVVWLTSPAQSSHDDEDQVIIKAGKLLRDKFIRTVRTTTTAYTQPSSHTSRPSFDTLEDMIKDYMESTGKDYRTFKKKSLSRDGHRCVVTGIYDRTSVQHCSELRDLPDIWTFTLQTAHIFNESVMQDIDPAASDDNQDRLLNKTYTAADALAILQSFGFSKFTTAFAKAGGVHQVWNLLTLEQNLHQSFDRLELWFEHTEKPHRYKVCTLKQGLEGFIHAVFKGADRNIDGAPMFVEFNTGVTEAPPPDPLLLAIHAACARVARMSGAGEFFDQIERDAEEISVLAVDGSSAPLLSNLLSVHAVDIPGVA